MMTVAEYLVKLSTGIALVYLFYRLVLRSLTFYQWNRFYLLGYLLVSFFLPFIDIYPWIRQKGGAYSDFADRLPSVIGHQSGSVAQSSVSAESWMLCIFVTGVVVCLVRLLVQCLSFIKMRRSSVLVHSAGNIRLYELNTQSGAFSFGNAIYINPRLHSQEELTRIIQHEIVHIRQQHSFDLAMGELLCLINWFNPFAWLLRHAIRQNLEFIADNNVLEKGHDKKEYQYLLLKAVGAQGYGIATHFNLSNLKKRIAMMNKIKSARAHLTRFLFVFPLLLIVLLAFRSEKTRVIEQQPWPAAVPVPKDTVPAHNQVRPEAPEKTKQSYRSSNSEKTEQGYRSQTDGKANAKGYFISIADNNGEELVVIKDKNRRIVKVMSMGEWEESASALEQTYGKLLPRPLPPVPPVPPLPPVPAAPQVPPVPAVPQVPSVPPIPELPSSPSVLLHEADGEMEMQADMIVIGRKKDGAGAEKEEPTIFSREESGNPVYILNGDIVSSDQARTISPEEIKTITIYKGDGAKAFYSVRENKGVAETKIRGVVDIKTKDRLYIVDGVEQPATFNIKTSVKPENIENIHVLKGQPAIDKYGSRGADGVIEIRTKK